jgi:hypothetical protein
MGCRVKPGNDEVFCVPGAMQRFFSAASQNRDPGFFESQTSWAPALQRTAREVT